MKKSKELGKKNEGKEFKKPSMRLESNVGMVKGNKIANRYKGHLKFIAQFKKTFLESRNRNGVKWVDILNMYSKYIFKMILELDGAPDCPRCPACTGKLGLSKLTWSKSLVE